MKFALLGYTRSWQTRVAFAAEGVGAITCDLLPALQDDPDERYHLPDDIWGAIGAGGWDYGLFHPMCTYLTVSAAWALKDPDYDRYPGVGYHQRVQVGTLIGAARRAQQELEIDNFERLLALPFPCVLENPAANFVSRVVGKPTQVIHPHQFGDDASKATGLWYNRAAKESGLPLLQPTVHVAPRIVDGKPRWANQTDSGQNNLTPGANRWLERSATYPGIAAALGAQHGGWLARS